MSGEEVVTPDTDVSTPSMTNEVPKVSLVPIETNMSVVTSPANDTTTGIKHLQKDNGGQWCLCKTFQKRGFAGGMKKFFWEGQMHNKTQTEALVHLSDDLPWHKRIFITHRRIIGLAIPATLVNFFWWTYFIRWNVWDLFVERWPVSIIMIFTAMVAGMTGQGGACVSFPVMTLALDIQPATARDFAVMIQAIGLLCVSFTIVYMRIQIERRAILLCSVGGWLGMILGFHVVDPLMSASQKKMYFASTWFAFAFALFLLNWYHKRQTFSHIVNLNWWRVLALIVAGFIGGIYTSFAGSGIDICCFSLLTLLFRVSEKVAVPTTTILMGCSSGFAFYWRAIMMKPGPPAQAYEYIAVSIPLVVVVAPLSSVLGSHFHRLVLALLVYTVNISALVAAFAIIPQTPALAGASVGIIIAGFAVFGALTIAGGKLLRHYDDDDNAAHFQRRGTESTTIETTTVQDSESECNSDIHGQSIAIVETHDDTILACTNKGFTPDSPYTG